jgi:hypothetical protein
MPLSFLLSIITLMFKKAFKKDVNFKKFLAGYDCALVIKTRDGKHGRRFIFKDGKLSTDSVLDKYDAAMIWCDSLTAFKYLAKGEEGTLEAMRKHLAAIDGKMHSFQWFNCAINYVMGKTK